MRWDGNEYCCMLSKQVLAGISQQMGAGGGRCASNPTGQLSPDPKLAPAVSIPTLLGGSKVFTLEDKPHSAPPSLPLLDHCPAVFLSTVYPRQVHRAVTCINPIYCPCLSHSWAVESLVIPITASTEQELLVLIHFYPPPTPQRMFLLPKETQPVAPAPGVGSHGCWKGQSQLKNSIAQ